MEIKVRSPLDRDDMKTYGLSYVKLRESYLELRALSDNDFFGDRFPDVMHAACIIAWFKELGNDFTIGDRGLIHELVHHLKWGKTQKDTPAVLDHRRHVREMFTRLLKLE